MICLNVLPCQHPFPNFPSHYDYFRSKSPKVRVRRSGGTCFFKSVLRRVGDNFRGNAEFRYGEWEQSLSKLEQSSENSPEYWMSRINNV